VFIQYLNFWGKHRISWYIKIYMSSFLQKAKLVSLAYTEMGLQLARFVVGVRGHGSSWQPMTFADTWLSWPWDSASLEPHQLEKSHHVSDITLYKWVYFINTHTQSLHYVDDKASIRYSTWVNAETLFLDWPRSYDKLSSVDFFKQVTIT
jgi:hypothetical protein